MKHLLKMSEYVIHSPLPEQFHWNRTVGPSNSVGLFDSLYRHFLCTVSARRSKASGWSRLRFCQKFLIHIFNFPLNGLKLLFTLYELFWPEVFVPWYLYNWSISTCTWSLLRWAIFTPNAEFCLVAFCLRSYPILHEDKWNNGKPWKNHLSICAEFFLF